MAKKTVKGLCLLLTIFFKTNCFAQVSDTINIQIRVPVANHEKIISNDLSKGVGKRILGGGLRFYKKYISSQDGSNCNFKPSCSEYCYVSIKKKGVFWGLLNAFDRLTRCNGNKHGYQYDPISNKLHDPIL